MTKQQVWEACQKIAPNYNFDPKLIFAICLQESEQKKDGSFSPDVARLEQGYYRKYVEPLELATTSEVLLSASYGITQMMGLSLKEVGYFDWYYRQCTLDMQKLLGHPLSQFAIPSAIDAYVVNLDWMINFSCKYLNRKRELAKGDLWLTLKYWNGSSNYPDKVLAKMKGLQ